MKEGGKYPLRRCVLHAIPCLALHCKIVCLVDENIWTLSTVSKLGLNVVLFMTPDSSWSNKAKKILFREISRVIS